ncbi:LysE family translocator [Marinomonas transparens]|uniref:LysE family translocator n=1 Tax=Marinomonas transparens TaxID=2795388 RepID=A0A934JQA1_9GAMM|nr:LysE family translocator [Marinomonas transparens]MBJ7536271.1 LysE family translocator [Marinomonas transparens]
MTITSGIALFFALLLSAVIPGPSVLAVVSRSMSQGLKQGLLVVGGVLIADYIYILLALTGLSTVSLLLGDFASLIKYLGIAYLFWLAYVTWSADVSGSELNQPTHQTGRSSLMAGVFTTLANPKAVLFYMGFFPAFIDLTSITGYEIGAVFLISTVAVGGVLSAYACAATGAGMIFKGSKAKQLLNKVSGGVLATCGVVLVIKS